VSASESQKARKEGEIILFYLQERDFINSIQLTFFDFFLFIFSLLYSF
jgi:hypothetical protein